MTTQTSCRALPRLVSAPSCLRSRLRGLARAPAAAAPPAPTPRRLESPRRRDAALLDDVEQPQLPLLLGPRRSAHAAGSRPRADAVVLEHRRRRLRPHRLRHRRRARLRDARRRPRERTLRHPALAAGDAAGARAARRLRLQRFLLPLPRHEDRRALRDRRAVDHRHLAADGRRPLLRSRTSTATTPTETAIRAAAEELYERVDWPWEQARPPAISMGWTPEEGFHTYDWRGYNEAMIVVLLALGSPTHPVDAGAWGEYTKTDRWGTFYGQEHILLRAALRPPVLARLDRLPRHPGRGTCARTGIDYFENSRRATLSQHAYAIANPNGYRDYGDRIWGLSACDGPMDATVTIDGQRAHVLRLRRARRHRGRDPRRRHDRADRRRSRRSSSRPSCRSPRCAR